MFTALLTGLRWDELVALQWTDFHLDPGKLSVRRNIPVGEYTPTLPKGGGPRVVDLLPPVRRLLMDLPQRGSQSPVFPGARGNRLNYAYFYRHVWRPAITEAKVQLRIHDLRHVYTNLLLAFGETVLS